MIYVCPDCDRAVRPIPLADGGWKCSACLREYAKPKPRDMARQALTSGERGDG